MSDIVSRSVRVVGDSVIVTLAGEVDASNADALEREVLGDARGGRRLMLELGDLIHVDSAGLRMVLRVRDDLVATGRSLLVVAQPGTPLRQLLRLTGIDAVIEVADQLPPEAAA
ncbi:MAG: STAS domain-containing protein [Thermoleophilia bacterium]